MLKKVSFLTLMFLSFSANAYLVSSYNSEKINYDSPTRILVTGAGDDLGNLFLQVARGKALKYSQQYPNEQIVLISASEKELNDENTLKNWGFKISKDDRSTLNGKSLIEETIKFNKIASLDIFSHSSAQYGIHLEGKAHRLTLNTKGIEKLAGHFIKDAFVYLHGCNTGFNLAPFLSNIWQVPVAGSMTSTNFQKLHSDGSFYLTEEGFFPNTDWANTNEKSFDETVNCKPGMCLRLKPDNNPYTGFWGEYADGGLSFYKWFCVKNSDQDCKRVMAKSLLSFIGTNKLKSTSNIEEYKAVVYDFLCPVSAKKDLRGQCIANLELSLITKDETYNPFTKAQVECNFKECQAEIECSKVPLTGIYRPGTCTLVNKVENGKATTLVREYKAYLEGFKSLGL